MESSAQDYFGESRLQAARSAQWLRRCNGVMLGVMLVGIAVAIVMVAGATIVNIMGMAGRVPSIESLPLLVASMALLLAFAKICLTSYRRGIDDLAERERWLREMDTLVVVARIAAESGNRQLLEGAFSSSLKASMREDITLGSNSSRRLNVEQSWPEARAEHDTVVSIEDLALNGQPRGILRHSLSQWKARIGEARGKS